MKNVLTHKYTQIIAHQSGSAFWSSRYCNRHDRGRSRWRCAQCRNRWDTRIRPVFEARRTGCAAPAGAPAPAIFWAQPSLSPRCRQHWKIRVYGSHNWPMLPFPQRTVRVSSTLCWRWRAAPAISSLFVMAAEKHAPSTMNALRALVNHLDLQVSAVTRH